WALDGPEPRELTRLPSPFNMTPYRLVFVPADRRLVCLDFHGRMLLWDLLSGQLTHEWPLPRLPKDVAVASDGRHLALVNGDSTVYMLRLPALAETAPAQRPESPALVSAPAAIAGIKSWTIQRKVFVKDQPPNYLCAAQAAWSPDGQRVAFSDDI